MSYGIRHVALAPIEMLRFCIMQFVTIVDKRNNWQIKPNKNNSHRCLLALVWYIKPYCAVWKQSHK